MRKNTWKNLFAFILGLACLTAVLAGGMTIAKKYGFDVTEVFTSAQATKSDSSSNKETPDSTSEKPPDHSEPDDGEEITEIITEIDEIVF